jgi:RNA polymerase sigma-70 factor (ECF subfamily)
VAGVFERNPILAVLMSMMRNLQHQTDEVLMSEIALKNHRAFETLYARYSKLVFSYFYRMLWKNRELANDMTQELFTKVVVNAPSFNTARPFKTWMYSIAHNMCKNEYAKNEIRQKAQMNIDQIEKNQSPFHMDLGAFKQKLEGLLQQLDEVKKETIELRFFQELSVPEIATAMNCSEGTVKSRIFYTLKDLQKELVEFKDILGLIIIFILS